MVNGKWYIILSILTAFLGKVEEQTLRSDFVITESEKASSPIHYTGEVVMHGQMFRLAINGIQAAYDGKTMYLYSEDTDELTLSYPTEQELTEANPFRYAQALASVCHVTERATGNGEQSIVTLTPKDSSAGIQRFTVRIRTKDLAPLEVTIREGQKETSLTLSNPSYVSDKHTYTIEPQGSTFVNDMRF